MARIYIVAVVLHTLFIGPIAKHHYHVQSIFTKEETRKMIEEYGGIIVTELQHTGKTSFLAVFTEYFPWRSTQEKLHKWPLLQRLFGQRKRPKQLSMNPGIHLTYQDELRVDKRGLYDCTEVDTFDVVSADLRLNASKTAKSPPLNPLDEKILTMVNQALNMTRFNDRASTYAKQYINDGKGVSTLIGYDINLYPAYLLGFTGKGVRISIVDDGIDHEHCDLIENYDPEISVNLVDPEGTKKSPRPPKAQMNKDNSHGTECAGLVAAAANNSRCSHGVAYKARIGGVRVLGGTVTDTLEAESFSYESSKVDIYCASWGPSDDGMTLDMPRCHTLKSIRNVWRQGRGGKGSLYVFACGNGGQFGDNCGADGFVGQPEVISVGALDETGSKAHYGESCASLRCSVPVGSLRSRGNILPTTSINNECMLDFAGTSAAAPLAAGCFALALESNPAITARDLDLLIPWCTRLPNDVAQDWFINSKGLLHSIHVGFGLLDCTRLAVFAKRWKPVGRLCISQSGTGEKIKQDWSRKQAAVPSTEGFREILTIDQAKRFLGDIQNSSLYRHFATLKAGYETVVVLNVTSNVGKEKGLPKGDPCSVDVVEKVVIHIQWAQLCRGTTAIWLESPGRTQTTLLNTRPLDRYSGVVSTTFTSVAHLEEPHLGSWSVGFDVKESCSNPKINELEDPLRGVVYHIDLEFWGTSEAESSFAKNKEMLEPLFSPIAIKARKAGRGKKLEEFEVKEQYVFQRELAYNFTYSQLQKKFSSWSKPNPAG